MSLCVLQAHSVTYNELGFSVMLKPHHLHQCWEYFIQMQYDNVLQYSFLWFITTRGLVLLYSIV